MIGKNSNDHQGKSMTATEIQMRQQAAFGAPSPAFVEAYRAAMVALIERNAAAAKALREWTERNWP